MQIKDIKVTPVTVPLEAPLRWSMGVETATTRSIIEIIADNGEIGIGETYGGAETVSKILQFKKFLINEDPYNLHKIYLKFINYFRIPYETSFQPHIYAGIEIALLDLLGKDMNKSMSTLLGGSLRDRVEFSGYLFYRYENKTNKKGGENNAEGILRYAREIIERYGFNVLKLKGGVLTPEEELRTIYLLRKELGEKVKLRFDPNAAWSVPTSINILKKMESADIEFVEDPTWGITGMSLVRRDIKIPLATNMCVITFDQIPLAVYTRAIDIIMGDIHYWGGPLQMKKVENTAEIFSLGISMHSDRELGVSTAAIIHYVASSHYIIQASDTHYPHQIDDIITEPFEFKDGYVNVPKGDGLGVDIDYNKLKKYNEYYKEHGEANEFIDPYRPEWIASLPLW
jgi:glucarate dehydratase